MTRGENEGFDTTDSDSVFSDAMETQPLSVENDFKFFMDLPIPHLNTTIKLPLHDKNILLCEQNIVGRGSYGTVYRYECTDNKTVVGLKYLKTIDPQKCQKNYAKFEKEIEIHKKLNHENVIKFFGSFSHKAPLQGNVIMILEYAQCGSLTSALESGRFDRGKILGYTKQILQALDYLHSFVDDGEHSPIIHRDLKGHNILLTDTGKIKLADFGICDQLNDMSTKSGSAVTSDGTTFWKAPEVIEGTVNKRRRHLRLRIDIWSVGVVMLEMFYGGYKKVPFMNHYTYSQYIIKLSKHFVPRAPTEAPTVVRNLMKSCFGYYPQNRPSALDLLDTVFSKLDSEVLNNLEMPDCVPVSQVMRSTDDTTQETVLNNNQAHSSSTNGFNDDYRNVDEDQPHLTPAPIRRIEDAKNSPKHQRRCLLNSEYRSQQTEKFLIISKYESSHSFLVIRKSGPETNRTEDDPIFVVKFDTDGKNLTLKDDRNKNIYSIINLDKKHTSYIRNSNKEGTGIFGKVKKYYIKEKIPFTKKRVKVTEILNTNTIRTMDMDSIISASSIMSGSSSLVIKKNKKILRKHNPDYTYTIRFKGTKKEVGKFDIDHKNGTCEIVSLEGTDAAMIITVTSFYLREKF